MSDHWKINFKISRWSQFKFINTPSNWFEVYQLQSNLFVIHEPRHYEATTMSVILGKEKAALIDTGCGIGNLRDVVESLTDKPLNVINTHTHTDHIGSNHQFENIALFDHPLSHKTNKLGVDHQTRTIEIFSENLIIPPLPESIETENHSLPAFEVTTWLKDGDKIDLGGIRLEVIHTPGEALNHICLLDRKNRILFSGDILLHGPIWTHLEGGSIQDLVLSYKKLMQFYDEFDHIIPSHNEPWISKELLPQALSGAESILSGEASYHLITDPWKNQLKEYEYENISFLTK